MDAGILLALLNPVMSAIFATVFATLWAYQPRSTYLRTLAICYAGLAVGLTLAVIILPIGEAATRSLANLLILLSGIALSSALFERCERPFPRGLFAIMGAATYGAFLWFLLVEPNVVTRIYVMNFGMAIMLLVTAVLIVNRLRSEADVVMCVLLAVNAALMVARPMMTLPVDNLAPDGSIALSTYWMAFSFSHAIISLLMVFALTTAFALDVMGELRATTFTDPLSGLLNRRGFEQAVQETMIEAQAQNLPLTIILCDLDHFKSINDTFGHHVGDKVIITFAGVLREVVGDAHVIGRVGGEEFAIVMAGCTAGMGEMIAQGVRVGFSSTPPKGIPVVRKLTASFGVAENLPGETYVDMMGRADAMLYRAKADGRDCVRVAPSVTLSVLRAMV